MAVDGTAVFSLVATGPVGLTYQWQILSGGVWTDLTDTGSYSGTATDTMTISPAGAGLDGSEYRCVVEWNINRYNISVVVSLQVGGCPTACTCALLIPTLASPYSDYATAEAVLADAEAVYDCFGYVDNTGLTGILTSTLTNSGTSIDFAQSFSGTPGQTGIMWISLNGTSGDTLSFAYTGNGVPGGGDPAWAEAILINIYDCAGTLLDTIDTGATGTTPVTYNLPVTGEYLISAMVYCTLFSGTCFDTASCAITSSGLFTVNPVIALWDDSGTTRQLEACPKMLLPPNTEGTGDWYANCTDAATAITNYVSNCVGYCEIFSAFSANDIGTSLVFAGNNAGAGLSCWGSISTASAGTLEANYSNSLGGFFGVYDSAGTVIAGLLGPGPLTTGTVPAGRYYFQVTQATDGTNPPGSMNVSASASFTVNPIQALYDVGLTCPARIDCGDSC